MTFHKYPKIKPLGHEDNEDIFANPEDEIVIEEKIDGANFRFMYKDKKLIFGSRTQQLEDTSGGNWKRCISFIMDKFADGNYFEGFIYYGECCVKHSMDYDWETIPPFLGFDIYDLKEDHFVDWAIKEDMFADAGLPEVPTIKIVKAKEIKTLTDDDVPKSIYPSPSAKDQQAEGIVLKNYSNGLMAKYVRPAFKEKNIETFGGSKKWATDGAGKLVAIYCTNARIDKIIFKLLDDGEKLDMPLMSKLPKLVMEDIYEEHWKEICWSKWSVDFQDVRKKINKRCVSVLKQMMVNNSLK